MNDDNKPQFVDGMFADEPNEKVIDFIKANVAFDLQKFWKFCEHWKEQNPDKKYMRVAIKVGKESLARLIASPWHLPSTESRVGRGIFLGGEDGAGRVLLF